MVRIKINFQANMLAYLLLLCCGAIFAAACSLDGDQIQPSPSIPASPFPTDTEIPLADLVITSISLVGDPEILCPAPDQPYQIKLLVENQGTLTAGPFVVQLNLDQQLVNTQLEPGGTIEVMFPDDNLNPRAFVDATSLVMERDENNNQIFQSLTLPTPRPECAPTPTPVIATQEALAVLEGHTAKVWDVEFSPDGKVIASGSVDNTLRLWNLEQRRLIRTMQGHPFPVLTLKYSPNGATLITGSTDGILRSWGVAGGELLRTLEGHTGWITGLDISRDGKWYVSCAEDSTVRLWRVSNQASAEIIDEGMSGVMSAIFTPDSNAIAWGENDGTVRLRTMNGAWLQTMKMGSQPIRSVQVSPDGGNLVTGSADGLIQIWRAEDGSLIQVLRGHTDSINALAYSPDGQWLVSASQDGTLRLWKFDNGKFLPLPVRVFVGHQGAVTSVDFSSKDPLIVSGSEDSTIRLWQLPEP